MTATTAEKKMFRLEFDLARHAEGEWGVARWGEGVFNGDVYTFTDDYIDTLYDWAEATYPSASYSRNVQTTAVNWKAARQLWTQVARAVTYEQAESSENLSDIAKQWEKIVKQYKGDLDELVAGEDLANSTTPGVMFGGIRKKPSRIREYPDDV